MEPGKVTDKNAHQIRERLYGQEDNIHPCNFEKGDKVRIPKIKNIHSKGYAQSKHCPLLICCIDIFVQIGQIQSIQLLTLKRV